jgi:hypothetical protein
MALSLRYTSIRHLRAGFCFERDPDAKRLLRRDGRLIASDDRDTCD